MKSYHEALQIIQNKSGWVENDWESSTVSLGDAFGRVLAAPVVSPESFPAFDASLFDGFALRSRDCDLSTKNQIEMQVSHHVFAGDSAAGAVKKNTAVGVSTGALLPENADVVLKIEDVTVLEQNERGMPCRIAVKGPAVVGEGIRYAGTDVQKQQVVLPKGTRLDFQHFPLLASLGVREVLVKRQLRVGIICTGDEIVEWSNSTPLMPGQLRNASGPFLCAILQGMGCELVHYSCVGDSVAEFERAFEQALSQKCDVVLTTGAVSVGERDFVEDALSRRGAEVLFHRVAVRPGKPIMCATLNAQSHTCVVFGLPGNPMSTVVGLRFFVTPYVQSVMGFHLEEPLRVALGNDIAKQEGLRAFFLGRLVQTNRGMVVYAATEQESFRVLPLARSNVWISLPEVGTGFASGDLVEVQPLFFEGYSRDWILSEKDKK